MDTFKAYQNFAAIKLHFTSDSYDYFKYHGKTCISWNSFEKFNGKRILHSILKNHQKDFVEFIATGFAYNPELKWIGDFTSEEVQDNWITHQRNMQSLTRTVTNELTDLLANNSIKEILIGKSELPVIEKNRIQGLTSIETCIILDILFDYINSNTCSHPLWENVRVVKKFAPFLDIDKSKFAHIVREIIEKK